MKEISGFDKTFTLDMFSIDSSLGVSHLEKDIKDKIQSLPNPPERVYFNKGL